MVPRPPVSTVKRTRRRASYQSQSFSFRHRRLFRYSIFDGTTHTLCQGSRTPCSCSVADRRLRLSRSLLVDTSARSCAPETHSSSREPGRVQLGSDRIQTFSADAVDSEYGTKPTGSVQSFTLGYQVGVTRLSLAAGIGTRFAHFVGRSQIIFFGTPVTSSKPI